jgi:hypothetical protein
MTRRRVRKSRAYLDGYADGLAWDLDGFDSRSHLLSQPHGWDEATLNSVSIAHLENAWGVKQRNSRQWDKATEDYNAGAFAGATAPQSRRTGLPPGSIY